MSGFWALLVCHRARRLPLQGLTLAPLGHSVSLCRSGVVRVVTGWTALRTAPYRSERAA